MSSLSISDKTILMDNFASSFAIPLVNEVGNQMQQFSEAEQKELFKQ